MSDYYAPTAYDSTKPRKLPPRIPRKKLPWAARMVRGNEPRLPWGVYVGDERNGITKRHIRQLKQKGEATLIAMASPPELLTFPSIRNPKMAWALLRGVSGMFLLIVLIVEMLAIMNWGLEYEIKSLTHSLSELLLLVVPFTLFVLGSIAVPLVGNKNNIILDRRTGLVTLPGYSDEQLIELRFDEFDPYLRWVSDPKTGGVYWRLHLGHRASLRGFDVPGDLRAPAYGYQNWEFIQQFMDISRPLPDRPDLEPIRHLDPTTVAYDEAFGRPRHFWRDQDPDEVKRQAKRIKKIILDFPWEYLPHDIEPYDQYDYYDVWPQAYPEEAKIIEKLENTGWWHSKKQFEYSGWAVPKKTVKRPGRSHAKEESNPIPRTRRDLPPGWE